MHINDVALAFTTPPLRVDFADDGFVGITDLNIVLGNWNAGTPPPSSAVPEPGAFALLGLGAFSLIRRRQR